MVGVVWFHLLLGLWGKACKRAVFPVGRDAENSVYINTCVNCDVSLHAYNLYSRKELCE